MKRRVIFMFCGMSLLACIAVSSLWIRSYFRSEILMRPWDPIHYASETHNGVFFAGWTSARLFEIVSDRGTLAVGVSEADWYTPRVIVKPAIPGMFSGCVFKVDTAPHRSKRHRGPLPDFAVLMSYGIPTGIFSIAPLVCALKFILGKRTIRGFPILKPPALSQ